MAADGRQGIVLLNQRQGFLITALSRHFQVALHRDVGGAGGFAGGGAGIVAIDAVVVPIVFVPHVGPPFHFAGQGVSGVFYGLAVLGAELLTQLHGTGRTDLHALATGDAVVLFHSGHIGTTGQVGGVKELGGAQGVADIDVAVADGENFVLAVDVGDLMDKTVFLTLPENFQCFFPGDVAAALSGFHYIVGHIAYGNTPAFRIVGAAFVEGHAGLAAGAGGSGVFAFVFIQPVGDFFDADGFVFRLNSLFHRDDMHTDARAAGGDHGSDLFQRQTAHPLEETAHFRVLLQNRIVHVGKLGASGDEHGQHPLLSAGGVLPVVLQNALEGHFLQKRLQSFLVPAGEFYQLRHGFGLANAHFQGNFRLLICQQQGKPPVFGVVFCELLHSKLHRDAVGDHLAQVQNDLPGFLVLHKIGNEARQRICHVYSPFHSLTSRRSHAATASQPSPVLAQIGKILAFGLRIWIYSVHFSISKSK